MAVFGCREADSLPGAVPGTAGSNEEVEASMTQTGDNCEYEIGPQYEDEEKKDPWKARMRLHQSWYRACILGFDYGKHYLNDKPYGNILTEQAEKKEHKGRRGTFCRLRYSGWPKSGLPGSVTNG